MNFELVQRVKNLSLHTNQLSQTVSGNRSLFPSPAMARNFRSSSVTSKSFLLEIYQ